MKKLLCFSLLLAACTSSDVKKERNSLSTLPLNTCEAVNSLFKEELTKYQDAVDEASKNYQEEQWRVETADPAASNEKMSKLFQIMQEKAYDKNVLEQTVTVWQATKELKNCPKVRDLNRVKKLLSTSILTNADVIRREKENQDLQDTLQNKSNGFRMEVEGEKEPVSKAIYQKRLGAEKDRATRERLFKASSNRRAKFWMDSGFKELIKSRNEEGKAAGYSDYYEYRFFRNQLDLKNYRSLVQDIKTKLAPKVRKVLVDWGRKEGIKRVEAWDMRYLREKASSGEINDYLKNLPETAVLEFAKRFYQPLGINVDSYGFTMDLYPRAGKNTHAFAMGVVAPHVDDKGALVATPKQDIRFLANFKKPVTWDDISTVIHELGHAIHFGEIRQPEAIFRGFGSVETEAIAMTVERMADTAEFLKTVLPELTGAKPDSLKPMLKAHLDAAAVEQAFVLVRQIFFSDFEFEVYKNPDADYASIWRRLHQEYWGVDVPNEYSDWDVDHFVMAPVYVENYAIGIVMVEQFYESILREFKTSYNSKAIGDKLKKLYFGPGLQYDYLELTQKFTGKPLTAKAALKLIR